MSDRSKPEIGCFSCGMQKALCICKEISPVMTETSVTVIIPRLEWNKTSNTGRLAGITLSNSKILIRGDRDQRFNASDALDPERVNLILFPGGVDCAAWRASNPDCRVNLIIPDGTWDSAARIVAREPVLTPLVKIRVSSAGNPPSRLRNNVSPERLNTLEAIACALTVLEGERVGATLLDALRLKVERILWARGRLRTCDVTGGVPETAVIWKTASGKNPV